MRKITFLRQHKTNFGGAENYLLRLVAQLEQKEIECEIIHSYVPKFFSSWMRAVIFNFQACLTKKDKFYFSLERINCPDIYRAGDGVHREFLKTKQRVLAFFNPLNFVYLYLEKKCFQNAIKIIANSNMIKNEIVKNYNIEPAKIEIVYNGIKFEPFDEKEAKKKLCAEFEIKENKKIILFVGSGFERKGVAEFLKIVSQIKSDFVAFVVGKEKKLNYYRNLAFEYEIGDRVIFTGARKDVKMFYVASDIFLFPTHYEPFSNVVLEALSFANVVFTTRQNGASEILEGDFVMENPNDFEVARKIQMFLNDELKLEKYKQKAIQLAQNFSIEQNASKTLEIILKVMDR